MSDHRDKWFRTMRRKLGVETNDEVRAYMAEKAKLASHPGTGGFHYLKKIDPERLKQVSSKGGSAKRNELA